MAKKETVYVLSNSEILNYAISYLEDRVRKGDEDIRNATDPSMKEALRNLNDPWFWKFKKLLELYKLETGVEYGYDFEFDFLKEGN